MVRFPVNRFILSGGGTSNTLMVSGKPDVEVAVAVVPNVREVLAVTIVEAVTVAPAVTVVPASNGLNAVTAVAAVPGANAVTVPPWVTPFIRLEVGENTAVLAGSGQLDIGGNRLQLSILEIPTIDSLLYFLDSFCNFNKFCSFLGSSVSSRTLLWTVAVPFLMSKASFVFGAGRRVPEPWLRTEPTALVGLPIELGPEGECLVALGRVEGTDRLAGEGRRACNPSSVLLFLGLSPCSFGMTQELSTLVTDPTFSPSLGRFTSRFPSKITYKIH